MQTIKGVKLEFINNVAPRQTWLPRQIQFNSTESKVIDTEVEKLLLKDVLQECAHETDKFVCTIFTRPKKDGSHRMIVNMKPLNEYIVYRKFKMDTLVTALTLVKSGCYIGQVRLFHG